MKIIRTLTSRFLNLNQITIKKRNIICGSVNYYNKDNTTIISSLHVNEAYRNNGIASKLLREAEQFALEESETELFSIHTFKLCAWEPTDSPYLIDFYKKRGYKTSVSSPDFINYYDDGDRIYELVKMSKEIVVGPELDPKNDN